MPPPTPLRLPSLDSLRAFEAAARLSTFERAADELCISASAIGKRIAALEDLLGTPMFERGGKALLLTTTGREYLQQAGAALALLTAMPQHQAHQQRAQRLRVTVPPTFARQILVPALASFTSAQPQIGGLGHDPGGRRLRPGHRLGPAQGLKAWLACMQPLAAQQPQPP